MSTIAELSDRFFSEERPEGNVLDGDMVLAQAIACVSYHAGYSELKTNLDLPVYSPPRPFPAISDNTEVSLSEWALIRPLFLLYIERENAIQLEASRGFGVDVYGRSSSEITADITLIEENYSLKSFSQDIVSV